MRARLQGLWEGLVKFLYGKDLDCCGKRELLSQHNLKNSILPSRHTMLLSWGAYVSVLGSALDLTNKNMEELSFRALELVLKEYLQFQLLHF